MMVRKCSYFSRILGPLGWRPRCQGQREMTNKTRIRVVAASAFAFLCLAPSAQASLGISGHTGGFGSQGGGGLAPMGVAVSGNGNGGVPAGTSYISQGDGRITQFAPNGSFVRAFGRGVV